MTEYTAEHPLRLIELFAGIGSQTQALTNIGVAHKVVAISEIDKYAIQSYEAMHGKANNLGDIRKIEELPDADLWTYSFPCQDISVAGKGAGIKEGTRSGLLFEVERLLRVAAENGTLPKYLLLENVKNLVSKKFKLRLNQWVKQNVRWMPMDAWDKCDFAVNAEKLLGRECYGGLDLSSSTDITAFVLVFPPTADDDKYSILPYFWIPEDTIDMRVRRDHVPYDTWLGRGQVIATEGNVIHYGYIENFIEDLGTKYHIKEIAFDRWGAVQMVQNLEGMGFTVVPFGQGFKDMSPPTKELMKLVLEQKIAHGGNVPLRWMMDNVYVRTDPAGNIKMDKEKSTERIDGAVATVMALDRAIRNEGSTDSVYNERGIIVI